MTGFSLIELLLVVVIMGILGAITIPKVEVLMTSQHLSSASTTVSNQLESAFVLALRARKPMTITFDSASAQFKIVDRAGNVYKLANLAAFNLTGANVVMSRSSVEVYPEGLSQDTLTVTFARTLAGTRYSRRVHMSRGGLVVVQ